MMSFKIFTAVAASTCGLVSAAHANDNDRLVRDAGRLIRRGNRLAKGVEGRFNREVGRFNKAADELDERVDQGLRAFGAAGLDPVDDAEVNMLLLENLTVPTHPLKSTPTTRPVLRSKPTPKPFSTPARVGLPPMQTAPTTALPTTFKPDPRVNPSKDGQPNTAWETARVMQYLPYKMHSKDWNFGPQNWGFSIHRFFKYDKVSFDQALNKVDANKPPTVAELTRRVNEAFDQWLYNWSTFWIMSEFNLKDVWQLMHFYSICSKTPAEKRSDLEKKEYRDNLDKYNSLLGYYRIFQHTFGILAESNKLNRSTPQLDEMINILLFSLGLGLQPNQAGVPAHLRQHTESRLRNAFQRMFLKMKKHVDGAKKLQKDIAEADFHWFQRNAPDVRTPQQKARDRQQEIARKQAERRQQMARWNAPAQTGLAEFTAAQRAEIKRLQRSGGITAARLAMQRFRNENKMRNFQRAQQDKIKRLQEAARGVKRLHAAHVQATRRRRLR